MTAQRKKLLSAVALALIAQALLFAPLPDWMRLGAFVLWAIFIPGHLLIEVVGRDFGAPATRMEWVVYAMGTGYALLLTLMLLLSYIPGPLPAWYLHVGVDLILLALLVAAWPIAGDEPLPTLPLPRWEIIALGLILLLAALLRLPNLGYADYHGDEARAVLRAAAVIQGYDDVLFLHKKGPTEILIPTAVFSALGNTTETTARLPFTIANLTSVATVFWLGRRLFGSVVGITAALLLAVDGFYIGFSRIVQYQSIVILMSALTLLVIIRLWQEPRAIWRGLLMAAFFLAAGLWSHYEAGLVALPALFAIGVLWVRYPEKRRALLMGLAGALALGGALLALFYVPYILHTQFDATYVYLVDRRIAGDGFPVNNVADLWVRLTTYSSSYYGLVMIAFLLTALVLLYRRTIGDWLGGWGGWVMSGALVVFVALTAMNPTWATLNGMGGKDIWIVLALLLLLPAWFAPRTRAEERLLWIWYGAIFIIMVGFTSKPRTHVYTFFMPWALLVSMVVGRIGEWLAARPSMTPRRLAWSAVSIATVTALIFGGYSYQVFAQTQPEVLRTWNVNWPKGYWRPYAALDDHALFGFPLANGWKAIGQLYANGSLQGDYATNEVEYWAPLWYTQGRIRCDDNAAYFFQMNTFQSDPEAYQTSLDNQLTSRDFDPWATITVAGEDRMNIRLRGESPIAAGQSFALEDYAAAFDAAATPDLPLGYPVVEPPIAYPLDINFENKIRLEGYNIEYVTPLQPSSTITLTLYWRALQSIDESYKVFNQSFYGDGVMIAQKDGYPICGSRGTWRWEPGTQVTDVHTLTISPDAPDGLYPLYTGMYVEATFDRLKVLDETGQPVMDQVHLTDLRVGEE